MSGTTANIERGNRWLPWATLVIYAATANWQLPVFADTYGAALEAWQWAQNGLPWLDAIPRQNLEVTREPFPNWLFIDNGAHAVSTRTIGAIAPAIPFSLFATKTFMLWPSTLAAVLLSTLAVLFMQRTLLSITHPGLALAGSTVFAFATPTWAVAADSLVPHSLTQAAIAAAAYAAAKSAWWWVGVAMGIGVTGRIHLVLVALVLGMGVAWSLRRPSIAVSVGLPTAIGAAVVVGSNAWRYGEATLSGGYAAYADSNLLDSDVSAWLDYAVNWLAFLFSPDKGLLVWTPLVAVLAVPAFRARQTAPSWAVWLPIGGFAYTAVQLKINSYTGGDAFYAYRLGLELVTCLTPILTLGWWYIRTDGVRGLTITAAWFQFAIISAGAVFPGTTFGQTVSWRRSALMVGVVKEPIVFAVAMVMAIWATVISLHRLGISHVGKRRNEGSPESSDRGAS